MPAVACFDTAFHATLPPAAATYRAPGPLARALGAAHATASTGSRTRGSRAGPRAAVRLPATRADRQLPPRRGRVAVRDRRRALGRHDDGLHAARGARDGDPVGQRRPGDAAVAARARAGLRARAGAMRSSTSPGWPGSPGPPTCGRSSSAPAAATTRRRLALDVYVHRLRSRSRRWRRRSAGSTCSRSPAASASTPPRCGRGGRRARVPGRRARRRPKRGGRVGDAEIGARAASVRTLVVTAREDLEMARRRGRCCGPAA